MWTNFADNGNKRLCMYNVCTLYTTAVGVISPRQLACCLHRNEYDIWCNVCCMYVRWRLVNDWRRFIAYVGSWRCYRRAAREKLLAGKCLWGNVLFASLTRHTLRLWALTRPSAQPTVPGQGKGGRLRLQRMAQLSDLVIWCASNWWMFGATVFCSLRSHGTRLLLTQQSKPCLVMGKAGVCVCACVVIS